MKPLRFHPAVQRDINAAIRYYREVSDRPAELFWKEVSAAFQIIQEAPEQFHFDPSGFRRFNLKRFPFNILFEIMADRIRITVVRHNSRDPSYGTRRQ